MAIGAQKQGSVSSGSMPLRVIASARGNWVTVNDDAETAQSATMLLRPASITDSTFHWMEVRDGATRCLVRARQAVGATVTTSPVIRVIGAYGTSIASDGSWPNTSAAAIAGDPLFLRLDNADWNAAGLTLTLVTSGTGLNRDNDYAYTDVMPDLTGIDMKGCSWVGVMVETAANVSAGTVPIQILLLN